MCLSIQATAATRVLTQIAQAKLVAPAAPRLLPWLLEALRRLQEAAGGSFIDRRSALLAATTVVKATLQQPTGRLLCGAEFSALHSRLMYAV